MTLTTAPIEGIVPKVIDALRTASASSGVDFDYLLSTAQRESGLNPTAQSKSSSATGLFQFVKQTWLATLKEHGAEQGYGAYADAIGQDAKGRYFVTDPDRAGEIFALRSDPCASSAMAAALTKETAGVLESRLGRAASKGELYAAHVLGAGGAARLIKLAESQPDTSAESCFPEAAAANRGLFNDTDGAPVSVAALYQRLTSGATACPVPANLTASSSVAPDTASETSSEPSLDTTAASVGLWRKVVTTDSQPHIWAPVQARAAGTELPKSFGSRYGFGGVPLTLTPQLLTLLSTIDPTKATHSDSRQPG